MTVIEDARYIAEDAILREMFEERKRVFVDLLKWDVPVLVDRYEIDQFDTEDAAYLVITGERGRHRASARCFQRIDLTFWTQSSPDFARAGHPPAQQSWRFPAFVS